MLLSKKVQFSKYLVKVRHIVPTLTWILIGSVTGLLLLKWLTSIQFNIIDVKEEVWYFWIPIVFPWIPILVWLRPRLRILVQKKDPDRLRFLFQCLAWIVVGIPIFFSQSYLTSAAGDLVDLHDISELSQKPPDRYYSIQKFEVLPKFASAFHDIRTTGKQNQHLDINLYFVAPIVRDSLDSAKKYNCWYGVKYNLHTDNPFSVEDREKKHHAFYMECIVKMGLYRYHELQYLRRLSNSKDKDGFINAVSLIDSLQSRNAVILVPVRQNFDARNETKLKWFFWSAAAGILIFLFGLLWPRYSVLELERQRASKKS